MNVIDAFFVTVGLDPSGMRKGTTEVASMQKGMREDAIRTRKEMEASAKRIGEGFDRLAKGAIALGLALLGARSIEQFIRATIDLDASTGRLAKTLGMSTEEVSAWEGAIRQMGGSNQDAIGSLQSLVTAFEQIQLTGQSPLIPYLQLLGVTLADLKNPTETLLHLADRFSAMDPRQAFALGTGMGLSPAMINLLIKGRAATLDYLEAARKAYSIHQADAEAAQQAQRSLSLLGDTYSRLGNNLLNTVLPYAIRFTDWLTRVAQQSTPTGVAVDHLATAFKNLFDAVNDLAGGNLIGGTLKLIGDTTSYMIEALAHIINSMADVLRGDLGGAGRELAAAAVAFGNEMRSFYHDAGFKGWTDPRTSPNQVFSAPGAPAAAGAGGPGAPDTFRGHATTARGGAIGGLIESFFRLHGFSAASARGIAAGVAAEGGGAGSKNPFSSAFGIGQWLTSRQKDFARIFGHDIHGSSLDEQLRFMLWELTHSERSKGERIRGAGSAEAAMVTYLRDFMRPGAGLAGDLKRGAKYLGATIHIDQLTVNTKATDAKGIARDIHAELATQANRGLF